MKANVLAINDTTMDIGRAGQVAEFLHSPADVIAMPKPPVAPHALAVPFPRESIALLRPRRGAGPDARWRNR